jgi:hypothetical protein
MTACYSKYVSFFEHCPSPWDFSNTTFRKLDLFASSGVREGRFYLVGTLQGLGSITGPVRESLVYTIFEVLTALSMKDGRAIAQAVSRWLPTAAARVRARGLVK